MNEHNYSFNVLFDEMKDKEKSIARAYGARSIPHKVIIDKDGFIRYDSTKSSWDTAEIVYDMSMRIEIVREN